MPKAAIAASRNISDYVRKLIEERSRDPGNDMISLVCKKKHQSRDGSDFNLSDNDILMFCNLLVAAGSETTVKLLGNMLVALNDHPE